MLGIGCDIIEIQRIAKAIEREHFVERVFTEQETGYCRQQGQQAAASFAARFAAKEAVLKALGTGLRGGRLVDVEVVPDALGKPEIRLHGYFAELAAKQGMRRLCVSLSHSRAYAIAFVTLE